MLWQDEAETACVAKNVLKFGLPVAFDGENLAHQRCAVDFDANFLWKWHPWAQFYVAAAGIAMFGPTTHGARLPFVVLAFLSVPLFLVSARRLLGSRAAAVISAVLLVTSISFLLYSRQSRYYALLVIGGVLVLHGWAGAGRGWGFATMTGGLVLIVHSNYVAFVPMSVGLLVASGLGRRSMVSRVVTAIGIAGLTFLPVYLAAGMGGNLRILFESGRFTNVRAWMWTAIDVFGMSNQARVFPSAVWLVLGVVLVLGNRDRFRSAFPWIAGERDLVLFAAIMFGAHYLLTPVFLVDTDFRYSLALLPVGSLALTVALRVVARRSALLAAVLFGLVTTSNLLYDGWLGRPLKLNRYQYDYVTKELRTPHRGPIRGIVEHLGKSAAPGTRVLTDYGALPLQYYLDIRVAGVFTEADAAAAGIYPPGFVGARLPDYIADPMKFDVYVLRRNFQKSVHSHFDVVTERLIAEEVETHRATIDAPDASFENHPYPPWHVFGPVSEGPPVEVLRR